jgi:hypothetical protein
MVHAWSVADNKVIDITYEMWEEDNNIDIGNTCVYFGVEIPVDFVWKNQQKTHKAEPVLLKYLHSIGYDSHANASTNSFPTDT